VRILVMDTEVYSNTGGQASKSTPRSAVAKFAAKGKALPKKDLGLMAMAYGYVYVARIAMGSNDAQTVKAFMEAEAHDGPSIIIAYSHCIAHGIDMRKGLEQQKNAVACGHWPLYRFNPALDHPMQIDSKDPTISFDTYAAAEGRYRVLMQSDQVRAEALQGQAKGDLQARLNATKRMAQGLTPAQAVMPDAPKA
jgi:pyruvate-ferredoxin/flavodoxin oxidoreductase